MLYVQSLAITVTEKCNMHCAHCLRGDGQDRDIDVAYIDTLLRQTARIDTLLFTGGEPTLNEDAIRTTLELCKKYDVTVYSFYLVTNGKVITDSFLHLMLDWYLYCHNCGYDDDLSGVALSKDAFHEPIDPENEKRLSTLSFFDNISKDIKWLRENETYHVPSKPHALNGSLLNMGRANDLTGLYDLRDIKSHQSSPTIYQEGDDVYVEDCTLTLTVDGELLSDCDYAYNDTDRYYICHVDDALKYLRLVDNGTKPLHPRYTEAKE